MAMMWADDQLNYFVQIYKSHECLWKFHNSAVWQEQSMRTAAYADISEKMLNFKNPLILTVDQVKALILSIRRRYYATKKRFIYSSLTPAEHVGSWYNDMEEILNYTKQPMGKKVFGNKLVKIAPKPIIDISNTNDETQGKAQEDEPEVFISNKGVSEQKESAEPKITTVSLQTRIDIMNIFKQLFMKRVTPTYKVVFDVLKKLLITEDRLKVFSNDSHLRVSVNALQKELTSLGYLYKETKDGTKMLIEDPKLRFERYLYLNKMAKIRNKQNLKVVYIDERIFDFTHTFRKYDAKTMPSPEYFIFFHAISRDGLINGLFCNQVSAKDFKKWVTDILLGLLTVPCVIVMDSNPLHGKLEDSCSITKYSTKFEMMKWLNKNNIPCSANTSKPELFELIMKNKKMTKEYEIDRIIRSHGHQVLRLPSSFQDLSMTEILWHAISESDLDKTQKKLDALQTTILDFILPSITPSRWLQFENLLLSKEKEILKIDIAVENLLDAYEFVDTGDSVEISGNN